MNCGLPNQHHTCMQQIIFSIDIGGVVTCSNVFFGKTCAHQSPKKAAATPAYILRSQNPVSPGNNAIGRFCSVQCQTRDTPIPATEPKAAWVLLIMPAVRRRSSTSLQQSPQQRCFAHADIARQHGRPACSKPVLQHGQRHRMFVDR